MRIAQTFQVASSPERVFDYMTDPANLRDWQTSKTRVEVLSDGPPGPGFRVRQWTKVARAIDRQFRGYHENLRRNVESLP